VTYGSFLGFVENVYVESVGIAKKISIRNLLFRELDGKTYRVRNAPEDDLPVSFATKKDLESFFPVCSTKIGYIGCVRDSDYRLPLYLEKLCYGNTAVLAGIGHGKSDLTAMIVSKLHLLKTRILIVDPTGEWNTVIRRVSQALSKTKGALSISSFTVSPVHYEKRGDEEVVVWSEKTAVLDALSKGNLVILDISFRTTDLKASQKLRARCWVLQDIQESLMKEAAKRYNPEAPVEFQTCVVLEEAHEFIPQKAMLKQEHDNLNLLFAISTKEYRKYGLGHIFLDQSLKAISEDIQIQTFILGSTVTPSDVRFLETQLGEDVVSVVQRTAGSHSWVAFGQATPLGNIPWEINAFKADDLRWLSGPD
jgi:hypothetical protein